MMNKLIEDIKTDKTGKGYDYYKGVSPHLQQHNTELETLSRAYTDLFRSVKRMLFGILGSVLVFSAFSAPFPWLRRAQAIGLAAGAGAIAAIVLGATTLSGKEASLSGPAFQIPWQTSLGAVVGYAVVHYVPDIPWVRKTLFPKPSSWKPIAWLTLGGTLAGAVSAIILFFIVPENTEAPQLTQGAALAIPGAAVLVAGFLIFARASGAGCLVLAVSLLVAWVAAYEINLGSSRFALDMSMVVVLTFVFLAGGAVIEPRLRQPSVWLVALLATAATGVLHYMIFETDALETLILGPETDKNIFGVLLYATLNMCVGAAIGYGLALPRNLGPNRSRPS
jgi:hypothetical protein